MSGYNKTIIINYNCIYFCNIIIIIINSATLIIMMFLLVGSTWPWCARFPPSTKRTKRTTRPSTFFSRIFWKHPSVWTCATRRIARLMEGCHRRSICWPLATTRMLLTLKTRSARPCSAKCAALRPYWWCFGYLSGVLVLVRPLQFNLFFFSVLLLRTMRRCHMQI